LPTVAAPSTSSTPALTNRGVTNPTHTVLNLKTATKGLDIANATSGNSEPGVRWIEYHADLAKPNTRGYLKFYTMSCHATSTRSLAGAVAFLPSNMAKASEGTFLYPKDNPYAAPGDAGRNAIYAIGFRHPETMIKDGSHLIVFDIGGSKSEEIHVLKLDGDEGKNFGWDKLEARSPQFTTTIPPVAAYTHVSGNKGYYRWRSTMP
jgi:hypothetical protein